MSVKQELQSAIRKPDTLRPFTLRIFAKVSCGAASPMPARLLWMVFAYPAVKQRQLDRFALPFIEFKN